jgi:hypothetical protein
MLRQDLLAGIGRDGKAVMLRRMLRRGKGSYRK